MPDPQQPEETILRKHCRAYLKVFTAQQERNLHAFYAHRLADSEADREFHLTAEEKKKRDAWLDSKLRFKGWNREPELDKGTRLPFDEEVLHAE